MTTLSSQERVSRMLAHQDHDRIPRRDIFWHETIKRWQAEGLQGDEDTVLEMLECDLHELMQATHPVPFPGQETILAQDEFTKTIRDELGKIVRYWKNKSGVPEHLGFGCDTRETWEKTYKPAILANAMRIDLPTIQREYAISRSRQKWSIVKILETFEHTRGLMGDEITMIAMAEDPDWILDVSHTFTKLTLQNLNAVIAAGVQPDGLWIFGDMAFKTMTFCSPAMYKELIWPDHKRLIDWAHAHNMKTVLHSDGNVNAVIDLYIDAGLDCLQPLEAKAGMDVRILCPKYGDKLAFMGNIDAMVLKENDLELIEHEIKTKFAAGMKTKGYAYHSDHSVPPQVSWSTYQSLIQLI
ncbi:MAG: hypothetical protein FWD53_12870, partial [Phycisphaerales bacterium]|nr:hypothetical protein [Phycisphaerales bacterium]